jgi:hypothetical protein
MSNIKITAEINGEQVPLENISTETFEAIKALKKPKEIPVARIGNYAGSPRLIFKPSQDIQLNVGRIYALNLKGGNLSANWPIEMEDTWIEQYENVKPL